jgi:hypothetical protein
VKQLLELGASFADCTNTAGPSIKHERRRKKSVNDGIIMLVD